MKTEEHQDSSVGGSLTPPPAADTNVQVSSTVSSPTHVTHHEDLPPESVIADILTHRHVSDTSSPRADEAAMGASPSAGDIVDNATLERPSLLSVRTLPGDHPSATLQENSVTATMHSSDLDDIDLGPPRVALTTKLTEQLPSANEYTAALDLTVQIPASASPPATSSGRPDMMLSKEVEKKGLVSPLLTEKEIGSSIPTESGVPGSSKPALRAAQVGWKSPAW